MATGTLTLQYDTHNTVAISIIEMIKKVGVFSIKEEISPYDAGFVREIQQSRKSMGKVIKTDDLWK
ncbi:MAG: hypothetical protein LBS01_03495 [Prevotellaceae bacterium]|jgi:hypothetical protein|nr:hypothetical protein [Prevotellaceae bacterium]